MLLERIVKINLLKRLKISMTKNKGTNFNSHNWLILNAPFQIHWLAKIECASEYQRF
jgi:hypothetical protein